MTVAPIVRRVAVKAVPARAFELFTGHMARWWPGGRTVGQKPFVDIVVEPHQGGRWFERDADGHETQWGSVLAWEPPGRLLLAWQLTARFTYDPAFMTEVELTFAPAAGGGTLVTLEHRLLERYGADAERIAGLLGDGWPQHLANFAQLANDQP